MSLEGAPTPLSPVRNYGEVWQVCAVFDVGGSGAHTIKYGSKGFVSVAKTATGKYTITFTDVGAALMDLEIRYQYAADTEAPLARYTVGSFSRSAKTAAFEVWDVDETAAQLEPASGADCFIRATFCNAV